ncbi:MAG: class I SAM-dependent rRNA methyltransferase [Planctomycetes bacterium]|nr:class I SAM-dependent rRNA methyltransferase [Planctomycetota bacterium]
MPEPLPRDVKKQDAAARTVIELDSDELTRGPWVFARQVRDPEQAPEPGALVEVQDASARFVGHALWNPYSDIRLRFVSRGRKNDLDRPREFLLRRIKQADDLRRKVLRLDRAHDAYRVVHAEGDDLSGLVVDRLGDALVCEYHALGFYRMRHDIEAALKQLYPKFEVAHRVPATAARAEGFDPDEEPELAERVIHENGLAYPVAPAFGHKTGWFCDQRENRRRVAELAEGRDVLDLCCNLGGFALNCAKAGAKRVRAVDLDEVVLERATRAAEQNQLVVDFIHADVFDFLRAERPPRPNLVILDPHKLVGSRERLEEGLRKYSDFNALAFATVAEGGILATFSCSGSLDEPGFIGMLFQAARRAGREVKLLFQVGAGPDHPQRPDFSRSRYLKGAFFQVT